MSQFKDLKNLHIRIKYTCEYCGGTGSSDGYDTCNPCYGRGIVKAWIKVEDLKKLLK